ncbi:hypothetical protein RJ640_017070 [Escallonia rubra]|uniref:AMP-dependent synthetase/ligase domain-containing protein n=1 Tax=Escallonia rubra TaxID=112253 RepID=A0AA88RLK2_9ASTE|nr:hypothetical protein RJ640_017070 [Escallonia rubra]
MEGQSPYTVADLSRKPRGVRGLEFAGLGLSLSIFLDNGVAFLFGRPVYLWTLPMFHSNGWTFNWGMAAVGRTNICLRKFDAAVVYAAISKHNVMHMCGTPVVLNMISNFSNAKPLKSPVYFRTGGAPLPGPVLLRSKSLGFKVCLSAQCTHMGLEASEQQFIWVVRRGKEEEEEKWLPGGFEETIANYRERVRSNCPRGSR